MIAGHTAIEGCRLIILDSKDDERGFFREMYHEDRYTHEAGMLHVKQVNWSISRKNVIRGIHITPFSKLVTCVAGKVYDVCVDMRPESPTYLKYVAFYLEPGEPHQVLIPANCGHGFMAMEDNSVVVYAQTSHYDARMERSVRWDSVDIIWPQADEYILSEKDKLAKVGRYEYHEISELTDTSRN